MGPQQGFSLASVVLSYFLVGGGMFTAMLIAGFAGIADEVAVYLMMAGGAFIGGVVAGRASRADTVLEPAIGAVAVIATIVVLAAATDVGKLVWHVNPEGTLKLVGLVGGVAAGGALAGAWLSERLLGESTTSPGPWVAYSALSTFGACLLATVIGGVVIASASIASTSGRDAAGLAMLVGIGTGCLISGIAIGASARRRVLVAALAGGILGTAAFTYLLTRGVPGKGGADGLAITGVFAGGGGLLTLIGTAIGWATVGKKYAG